MLKQTITEDYNQDWPLHYHEIPTPELKKTYLLQHQDTERLEVFEKRYSTSYADTFMSAWLELKTMTTEPVHFFNKKLKEKQELTVGGKNRHEAWNCGTSKCWKEYII